MTKKLAIYGGNPVITKPFEKYQTIGKEEEIAVLNVLKKVGKRLVEKSYGNLLVRVKLLLMIILYGMII